MNGKGLVSKKPVLMSDVDSFSGEDQSNPTGTVANNWGQVL